ALFSGLRVHVWRTLPMLRGARCSKNVRRTLADCDSGRKKIGARAFFSGPEPQHLGPDPSIFAFRAERKQGSTHLARRSSLDIFALAARPKPANPLKFGPKASCAAFRRQAR